MIKKLSIDSILRQTFTYIKMIIKILNIKRIYILTLKCIKKKDGYILIFFIIDLYKFSIFIFYDIHYYVKNHYL